MWVDLKIRPHKVSTAQKWIRNVLGTKCSKFCRVETADSCNTPMQWNTARSAPACVYTWRRHVHVSVRCSTDQFADSTPCNTAINSSFSCSPDREDRGAMVVHWNDVYSRLLRLLPRETAIIVVLRLLARFVSFVGALWDLLNPLMGTANYSATSNNYEFGTLAVDGWAVTFGTARRGLGGAAARPGHSLLYQM